MTVKAIVLLLLGICCFWPSFAQSQSPTTTDNAKALIEKGVKLKREKQYETALSLFHQAWRLSHSPHARAQIGLTEQILGLWIDAETHLQEALAATSDSWISKNRQALEKSLHAIGQHLGSLNIRGGVPGAEVRINGRLVGTLPLKQPARAVAGT